MIFISGEIFKRTDKMNRKLPTGYMGKILHVDLTNQKYEIKTLDPDLARLFFGGRGLGAALLSRHFLELQKSGKYENAFAEVQPFSGDNVIVISTAPTTGTRMPTSGRFHMNYKSPLTGAYGSTNAGGRWAVDFKRSGFDAMIITGKSPQPVYLLISPGKIEFMDARPFEHLDAIELREAIRRKHDPKASVLTIGQAGRKGAHFANVMSDTGKALGRGGGGAVWGSKYLHAIAVLPRPDVKIDVADEEAFKMRNEKGAMYHVKMKLDVGKFTKKEDLFGMLSSMGSLGILGMVNNYNQLIHNNMRDTNHEISQINKINGEALRYHYERAKRGEKRIKVKKSACYNCSIICKRETTLLNPDDSIIEKGEGPEFETVTLMGANLSIYDLPTIVQANYLANRYGLDTISLGATIASFFELYEKVSVKENRLTAAEQQFMDDVSEFVKEYSEPHFGKKELLVPLVHLIGKAEGIGKHLAKGSYEFSRRYGHPELSMSVKKLELPAYDPRTSFSQALCYEMNNRGGCHLEGGYTAPHAYCAGYSEWSPNRIEGTPLISKNATLKNTALDIIGACAYGSFSLGLDEYASLVNAVTGEEHNSGTLQTLAQRTITLERAFNVLCGISSENDWLPKRFYEENIRTRDGEMICIREAFDKMHKEYYHSVGWDEHGKPTAQTLQQMNLMDFVPKDNILQN
ncbi:hypothetical protein GF337_04750 [candidate division KSB1 bacterium]|nr:hypothetical protein [candidate division KSB1 bacterium]